MTMLIWILGIYSLGVGTYFLFSGWLRGLIASLSWIIALLFLVFNSFAFSVPGEAGWGIAYIYLFFAPLGLFSWGQVCANIAYLLSERVNDKIFLSMGMALILLIPPLMYSWSMLIRPKVEMNAKREQLNARRLTGVFDFYFAGLVFQFPCHDSIFAFYGFSRHGGDDVCRLGNTTKPDNRKRRKLSIPSNNRRYHFCEKNGTPERNQSPYCLFRTPAKYIEFYIPSENDIEAILREYTKPPEKPTSMVGGLRLVDKSVRLGEPSKYRSRTGEYITRPRHVKTTLMFTKEWPVQNNSFSNMAHIRCHDGGNYGEGSEQYRCTGKIKLTSDVWAGLSFNAFESDIEINLDEARDGVWSYWLYLDDTFRVWPIKEKVQR